MHYPTDIHLLFDAIRKAITLVALICSDIGFSGWRQSRHNIRGIKRLFNKVRKLKRSTSKDEKKKAKKEQAIIEAHRAYMDLNQSFLERAEETIRVLRERKKHPAIESAINASENHDLDLCPDHGTDGFDRYVALAVTARNIQILGNIIQKKELRRQKRGKKHRLAA